MKKIEDIETALNLFEKAAIQHTQGTEQGDYKLANKNYVAIVKAVDFLKEQDKVSTLEIFLNHASIGVRVWAAAYLLSVNEKVAVQTLEQISEGTGIISANAKITLSEWLKGNLKL